MAYETEKEEVAAAYRAYQAAFFGNDMTALDGLVVYPLAYVAAGRTMMLDAFPIRPSQLMAEKQWHTTADMNFDVVGVSADKAHVVLPHARRLRSDGSLIETVSAFYAFTKTGNGWKLFAISDIVVPA
jgi:hypothetical protein